MESKSDFGPLCGSLWNIGACDSLAETLNTAALIVLTCHPLAAPKEKEDKDGFQINSI